MKLKSVYTLLLVAAAVWMTSCSCESDFDKYKKHQARLEKAEGGLNPVDRLKKKHRDAYNFAIILDDMKLESWMDDYYKYYHKYKVIGEKTKGEPFVDSTGQWVEVSEDFHLKHKEHFGMEIAQKDSTGKITDKIVPAGFTNYVGNPRYGQWTTNSSGDRVWQFLGTYMLMSAAMNMMSPYRYGMYNDYRRSYSGNGAYYGRSSTGGRQFGTGGSYTSKAKSNSFYQRKVANSPVNKSFNSKTSTGSIRGRSSGFGK